jgi:hypothetical protein
MFQSKGTIYTTQMAQAVLTIDRHKDTFHSLISTSTDNKRDISFAAWKMLTVNKLSV